MDEGEKERERLRSERNTPYTQYTDEVPRIHSLLILQNIGASIVISRCVYILMNDDDL